jgi:hypothetical protein
MDSEPIQVTKKVVTAFEDLGIPYLIGGSFASAVHGVVRATMDADVVADIKASQVEPLVGLLQQEFYISSDMVLEAIRHASSFNMIHLETMFKVDVFILKQRPFDLNQMQRRISQSLGESPDEKAYFCTAEDIILAKLEWYRAGGEASERQLRDITGILELQGNRLDFEYMRKWAEGLGVKDLLERAIQSTQHK